MRFYLYFVTTYILLFQMFHTPEREDYLFFRNIFSQPSKVIVMAIGTSRIYRGLADYSNMTFFNWVDAR